MKNILLKSWLPCTVSMLTALCILQFQKPSKTQVHHKHAPVAPIAAAPAETLATKPTETASRSFDPHAYSYMFTGLATINGQALANARLEIRVTSEASADIHYTTTDSTGRFYLPVSVDGQPNQTLSWEIRGVTDDLKRVALEGHQILTEDHVMQVSVPAQFAEI